MMGFGPWESDWGQLRRGENEEPRPGAPTGMQRERLERRKASQGMDLRAPQQQKGMNGAAFEERRPSWRAAGPPSHQGIQVPATRSSHFPYNQMGKKSKAR